MTKFKKKCLAYHPLEKRGEDLSAYFICGSVVFDKRVFRISRQVLLKMFITGSKRLPCLYYFFGTTDLVTRIKKEKNINFCNKTE